MHGIHYDEVQRASYGTKLRPHAGGYLDPESMWNSRLLD